MIIGDTLIQASLQAGLREITGNVQLLEEIGIPARNKNELAGWMQQNQDRLGDHVVLGYPDVNVQLPVFAVMLGDSQETEQPIGMHVWSDECPDEPGLNVGLRGTWKQAEWRIVIVSANANLTVWLGAIAEWQLLRDRDNLEDAGLLEQRVGQLTLEPQFDYLPVFAFSRGVTLQAKYLQTFKIRGQYPTRLDTVLRFDEQYPNGQTGGDPTTGGGNGNSGGGGDGWIDNNDPPTGGGGDDGPPVDEIIIPAVHNC